ncbi:ATP-dependent DNA helicase [Suillus fuscotomentosus]|uniref:ATP-dependent DNA helicase n=1 Tax=Suillus fuscotomentosus TaxID=1912939 RepID=A0AAD4E491_9AGAM|nr:ATP-dependent DNA helicase [Suillus fuscotomentosus]KAG1899302.1 ATP-dependent DNA helicase [Suillus fuscotomentosus]
MEDAHRVLKNIWDFPSFRLSQEEVIKRLIVDNENALVLYPTGGGKSLTYQVPALCLPGLTVVISPLIALMKDQVDALVDRGVKAANLDSTLGAERAAWVKQEVVSGRLKLLYVAPERLNNEGFIAMMSHVKISLLAIDESHCISQWGASFRPEYLKIARFAEEMDVERVLCLTATATPNVAEDICKSFFIDTRKGVFRTPVYRSNLALKVQVANTLDQKLDTLIPFLKSRTGPAIIYVTLQKHTEEVAGHLRPHGMKPMVYHAGLNGDERARVQQQFMDSDNGIVCATIAFGMGIDKANIRQVVHLFMPKTLENYCQEVGRAGRDGLPSTCLMFLSAPDIPILEGFCRGDTCSKRSLHLWLQEVALKTPDRDGTLSFNNYQQSKEYDIRPTILGLSYAQLELEYNYIRAVTPLYSQYDISSRTADGWQKVMGDKSEAAKIIKMYWKPRGSTYQIDVVVVAQQSGQDRGDLARKISDWELSGWANVKASQVRARYKILNPLPMEKEEIANIAEMMYNRMLDKEEEAIVKLRQVINFATNNECMAQCLASYFGDEAAIPTGLCGSCSFCQTGKGITFEPGITTLPDPIRIKAILNACPERDDPRLLARMAFGVTSPRLTAGKWSTSHPLFGSMVEVDFNALVEAFDKECARAGYANAEPTPTNNKRPASQSASYGACSRSSGGRGGTTKRARRS